MKYVTEIRVNALRAVDQFICTDHYQTAIDMLTADIEKDSSFSEAVRIRGYVYYHLDDFERSIIDSTNAINSGGLNDASAFMAHYYRARAYATTNEIALALEDAQVLLKVTKLDRNRIDDACDLLEQLVQVMKQGTTSDLRDKMDQILKQLQSDFFSPTDPGHQWVSEQQGLLKTMQPVKDQL